MQLTLIRHPEPDIEAGICYGALDIPAKPAAMAACLTALTAQLLRCDGAPIYTSPLQRCAALASALQAALPSSRLAVSPELVELNFGSWEGRSWDEIYANDAAGLDAWAAQPVDYAPGGGESLHQLHHRVMAWLSDLQHSGCDNAIVVSHGGPLRVLLCAPTNCPQAAYAIKAPPWGSLNVVTIG